MLQQFKIAELPTAPRFRKLIGPSFIILGLGLGSGELILWPYLTSNFGMGIIWGAVLGITFQFFMNMEIERYALIRGESIFVGFARKWRYLPIWFLFSTFVPWIWPGIIAASAKLIGAAFGITITWWLASVFLVGIALILSLGPVLYKTVEGLQKILISLGVPFVFILAFIFASRTDWVAFAGGIVGMGEGYWFLPAGIPIATFLAALAYSGAGGNLNLAQSFYVKEKGYGMGKYGGRITSLITGKAEDIQLTGTTFEGDGENLVRFKKWWKLVNIEHFLVFWLTGAITIALLGLLSFSTTHGAAGTLEGINFVLFEAQAIGARFFPFIGTLFLIVAGIMLFATQLTVFDATSRILAENVLLLASKKIPAQKIRSFYYIFVWAQCLTGVAVFAFGFTEPLSLLILSAVLNAFAMFVHLGLTLWLNLTSLEKYLRPKLVRRAAMTFAFLFFGGFSLYTIYIKLFL